MPDLVSFCSLLVPLTIRTAPYQKVIDGEQQALCCAMGR